MVGKGFVSLSVSPRRRSVMFRPYFSRDSSPTRLRTVKGALLPGPGPLPLPMLFIVILALPPDSGSGSGSGSDPPAAAAGDIGHGSMISRYPPSPVPSPLSSTGSQRYPKADITSPHSSRMARTQSPLMPASDPPGPRLPARAL